MFYNLKIAWNKLGRDKFYATINISGLAMSLMACAFILLWIKDERSYDRFHKDAENIYAVISHFDDEGEKMSFNLSSGLFAPTAKLDFDAVESYCRIVDEPVGFLQYGDIQAKAKTILMSDSTFFSFFGFPIVKGQMQDLLREPYDVVISESLACELFGDEDPIDKTFLVDGQLSVRVSAVMKDFPHNTSLPRADLVCSYKMNTGSYFYRILDTWQGCEFKTFLRLKRDTDITALAAAVTDKQTMLREMRSFTLQPLTDMHLYTVEGEPAGIKTLRIFILIAMVTLLIACVNYVNLITARFVRRRGEIILKKTLGAKKRQLFAQLMTEAFMLFLVAVVFAIMLNLLLMPLFNQISGKELSTAAIDPAMWRIYAWMLLLLMGLAGVYPAWLLTSFNPAKAMQERKRNHPLLRNVLVVFQFVVSMVLIATTLMMDSQLKYMRNKDLGFNKEQVLVCNMYYMSRNFATVKSELMRNAAVRDVTNANQNIMSVGSSTTATWERETGESALSVNQIRVDTSFINVMQISLAEGQNFTSLALRQVIPNETAIKAMGMQDPVGKWMEIEEWDEEKGVIVGVAKDFNFTTLYEKVAPVIIYFERPGFYYSQLFIRTEAGEEQQAIAALEKLWQQYNPKYAFEYHFLNEEFDHTYKSEIRTNRLFRIFSCIAILISCLGLFGLITFMAESKTKEIGIRKTFGASVSNIVAMLSKEFLMLVGIAVLIAFPVAYYWSDTMLQEYAYRIDIGWWMFALAAGVTVVLTLLTVGVQALRAAVADPIRSISNSE